MGGQVIELNPDRHHDAHNIRVRRYLSNWTRRLELCATLFVGGFVTYAGVVNTFTGIEVLGWTTWSAELRRFVAHLMIVSFFIHAMGISINGRWKCSPCLRFAAMVVNTCIFAALAVYGYPSSAGYTYAVFALWMAMGAKSALDDTVDAWRGVNGTRYPTT